MRKELEGSRIGHWGKEGASVADPLSGRGIRKEVRRARTETLVGVKGRRVGKDTVELPKRVRGILDMFANILDAHHVLHDDVANEAQ